MENCKSKSMVGLDLGDATIGIAVSDVLGFTAQPYENYRRISKKKDIDYIVDLALERGAHTIVVGMPVRLDGSVGPQAEKTLSFVAALEKKLKYSTKTDNDISVKTFDERFTSAEAERMMKSGGVNRKERSGNVDKIAASLILQAFLEMNRNKD